MSWKFLLLRVQRCLSQESLLLQLKTPRRRKETRNSLLAYSRMGCPGWLWWCFGDAGAWGCSVSRAARVALSNIPEFWPLLIQQTYFRSLMELMAKASLKYCIWASFWTILDTKISLLLFQRDGTCNNWCFVEISWAITGFSGDKHCLWPHALSSQQQDYCLIKQLQSSSTIIL